MRIRSIEQVNVKNKRVILRTDYNVPIENGVITDDRRITATLKTIKYLIEKNSKIIIVSHMGRPSHPEAKHSLKICRDKLAALLGMDVHFIEDLKDNAIIEQIDSLPFPSVIMIENIRFWNEERVDDIEFASWMSNMGDVYINEGFAVAHRKDMSVHALPLMFKERAAGFLFEEEVTKLSRLLNNPAKPYLFIIGGSKVSTKVNIIENILNYASTVVIGGGLAFTFLKSQGFDIGKSLFEPEMIQECQNIFKMANDKNVNILLPVDVHIAKDKSGTENSIVRRDDILPDEMGLDIGTVSIEIYKGAIMNAKTIVWNGPMGLFENPKFAEGTNVILESINEATKNGAYTVVGGGDTCAAIDSVGGEKDFSFISTGGGAMLEFLSGIDLPGVRILMED